MTPQLLPPAPVIALLHALHDELTKAHPQLSFTLEDSCHLCADYENGELFLAIERGDGRPGSPHLVARIYLRNESTDILRCIELGDTWRKTAWLSETDDPLTGEEFLHRIGTFVPPLAFTC
jgi:hypothetical protein